MGKKEPKQHRMGKKKKCFSNIEMEQEQANNSMGKKELKQHGWGKKEPKQHRDGSKKCFSNIEMGQESQSNTDGARKNQSDRARARKSQTT